MEYKPYQYHNTNLQTLSFITKEGIIDCFSNEYTKEVSQKSIIKKDFWILRRWQFQWEIVILKIS